MDKSLLLAQKEQAEMLPAFDELLLFSLERRYLEIADVEQLELATNMQEHEWDWKSNLRMLRVEEVSYEDESRIGLHLLNMQNVLASLKDDSHNVISVIHSTHEKTSLYYGLSRRIDSRSEISTDEYAKILRQSLHGNFLGVKMHKMTAPEIEQEVLDPIEFYTNIRAFPGIPSLRVKDPNAPYVQGIDRFIEGMRGEEYCLVTIAEPIPLPVIDGVIKNLFDLSSSIHSQVKATVQKMKGSSDTVNVGMFGMSGSNEAQTISEATTDSTTRLGGGGAAAAALGALGTTLGTTLGAVIGSIIPVLGTAIGATAGGTIGSAIGAGIGAAANWLTGATLTRTESFTKGVANTLGRMTGLGGQGGYARGWNRSQAVTQEVLNKTAEYCEKLCDAYIERLQAGKNLGLWNVGVYLLTDDQYTQLRAQGLLRAAFSGDTTYWEPMRSLQLNYEAIARYIMNFNNPKYDLFMYGEQKKDVREAVSFGRKLKNYASRVGSSISALLGRIEKNDNEAAVLLEKIRLSPDDYSEEDFRKAWSEVKKAELGHPFGDIMGGVSTPLNTEELSIIMNVPRQEVQGITIREAAPFNVVSEIREYGEGVIIVDQIPSKLTPDIVKNTNIKIIHRTLAKDDREYVGSTMNLTEQQDRELCILEVGRAVVHREGMDKAFLVQMDVQKSGLKNITNDEVREHMKDYHAGTVQRYGLDKREGLSEAFGREDFRRHSPNLLACMVSSLLVLMTQGDSAMNEARKTFAFVLGHDLGITDGLRADCHALHNIGLLFSRLQEHYGGNYRACLRAERLFIDAWFGGKIDAEALRVAVADFTNADNERPFAGVLKWYSRVEDFRHTNNAAIVRLAQNSPVNFAGIDALMREVIYKLMCGMSLPRESEREFSVILFNEIFAVSTGYYARDIADAYSDFLRGNEHNVI